MLRDNVFITLEGIDGSGKSSQALMLSRWLEAETGRRTVHTYEPGGWPSGENFRKFILGTGELSSKTELLIFLADRSEHIKRTIKPALDNGCNVVCERWNASTIAYQTSKGDLAVPEVKRIIHACNFPVPDVQIFLDISPSAALQRIKSRGGNTDKYEAQGLPLLEEVSRIYSLLSDSNSGLMRIQCDNMSEGEVFSAIKSRLGVCLWQSG